MTDSVTPIASVPPVQPTAPRVPAAPIAGAPAAPSTEAAEPKRQPLTVDVADDNGVFVYTLRDPATDTVLTVIPREMVLPNRDGRLLDQRV